MHFATPSSPEDSRHGYACCSPMRCSFREYMCCGGHALRCGQLSSTAPAHWSTSAQAPCSPIHSWHWAPHCHWFPGQCPYTTRPNRNPGKNPDRKSVLKGKSVSVRVDLGGGGI